ncbi:MAG: phosphate acyltransferase PlsX [Actinomycetia bacterium]|nr:phosphate acyltransferase PlsX [Actinomycetes bacterium]
MKIAVDALGGDQAPSVVLEGVTLALQRQPQLELILCGPAEVVEPFTATVGQRSQAKATTEHITMAEHPAEAVRQKKDSSIVVGCRLVAEGRAGGFFSAGSTGACMAAATLIIGRIPGIARPAIASVLPTAKGHMVLADVGANADVKPEYLLQFAQMAEVYARQLLGVAAPRVGLLNIGAEESKGSMLAQAAYVLMRDKLPSFVGNVEGKELLSGDFDVVVSDGFTGNVTLKTIEGLADLIFAELKQVLTANVLRKLAAAAIKPGLKGLKQKLSADAVGGAPLLGVKGSCLIGHGSSTPEAIANGILATWRAAEVGLPAVIEQAVRQ